jgi:hypothetical protein
VCTACKRVAPHAVRFFGCLPGHPSSLLFSYQRSRRAFHAH